MSVISWSLGSLRSPASAKAGTGASAAPASRAVTEASALLVPNADKPLGQRLRTALRSPEALFVALCVAVLAVLAVLFAIRGDIVWIIWLVAYGIQRLPIIVLLTIILINRNESEGPGALSKLIILSAALLALLNDLPVTVWAEVPLLPLPYPYFTPLPLLLALPGLFLCSDLSCVLTQSCQVCLCRWLMG